MPQKYFYQKIGANYSKIAKNWRLQKPPLVPSWQELRFFKKTAKDAKRICIFGSTPGLRDVAHSLKAEVTVVDINFEMMLALEDLMKYKNRAKKQEILLQANWLKAPLAQNYYDAIFADWTYCNLFPSDWSAYICQSANLLRKGGKKIIRIYALPKMILEPEFYVNLYKKKLKVKAEDVLIYLLHAFWNKNDKSEKSLNLYNYLKKYSQKNKAIRDLYLLWDKIVGKKNFVWWTDIEKSQIKLWGKYFKVVSRFIAADYATAEINPVYVFEKKQ